MVVDVSMVMWVHDLPVFSSSMTMWYSLMRPFRASIFGGIHSKESEVELVESALTITGPADGAIMEMKVKYIYLCYNSHIMANYYIMWL